MYIHMNLHIMFFSYLQEKKKERGRKFSHIYASFPYLSAVREALPDHQNEAFTEETQIGQYFFEQMLGRKAKTCTA